MKFSILTALAVGLVAAAPRKRNRDQPLEVAVLGGATFKVPQVANTNYRTHARGPRELAKAYHKFGVEFPAELRQVLQRIAIDLGVSAPSAGRKGNGILAGTLGRNDTGENDTTEGDQGR